MILFSNIRLRSLRPLMRVCFLVLFALLMAASPALAQQIQIPGAGSGPGKEPIHIASCTNKPFVISQAGSYVVTADLSASPSKDCIDVLVGSVTIDLNGFVITG